MKYDIKRYKTVVSTNDEAKRMARLGAPEGTVILAEEQTGGRGRYGRSFYSPQGGLYMSLILRPEFDDVTLITPAAAVAVCRSVNGLGFDCKIKWVNDIYKNDKKVCGVLTESDVSEGWAVLGIGINIKVPGKDAPDIAGGLYDNEEGDSEALLRTVLDNFAKIYEKLPRNDFIEYYRERSYLSGKTFEANGEEYKYAGISDGFGLLGEANGRICEFRSGEISVKIK